MKVQLEIFSTSEEEIFNTINTILDKSSNDFFSKITKEINDNNKLPINKKNIFIKLVEEIKKSIIKKSKNKIKKSKCLKYIRNISNLLWYYIIIKIRIILTKHWIIYNIKTNKKINFIL